MPNLLRKPTSKTGKLHDISAQDANWQYVGFGLYHLKAGESAAELTQDNEVILVFVEGKAKITASGQDFGELGDRMNVFEQKPPVSVYVPNDSDWQAVATTDCTLAICAAPGKGNYKARVLDKQPQITRGVGSNTRHVYPIAMEEHDVADSLLVTEAFTPEGNWSSYPPHRHDEDDFPNVTHLEETYYHRINPTQGYIIQKVFTEDGEIDETLTANNGDVVLVPKGHHPCGVPHGYELYYLNVMAGPKRKWRFINHPDHQWIADRDEA
ncbi:MAG: 5-deoxy-glucuronate isomerase [Hyphomicrobiales bacterium]